MQPILPNRLQIIPLQLKKQQEPPNQPEKPGRQRLRKPNRLSFIKPPKKTEPIFTFVEELDQKDILQNIDGIFYELDDYEASWAQLNWYQWEPSDFAPVNFVLTASIQYESASTTANWADSGCGFVFRDTGDLNHYRALAALDGYVYLSGLQNGNWISLGRGYYGHAKLPAGSFEMAIVVEDDWITIYLDGEQMIRSQDSTHTEGFIGYTLASGTNKDFGTYCRLSDIDLWILQ